MIKIKKFSLGILLATLCAVCISAMIFTISYAETQPQKEESNVPQQNVTNEPQASEQNNVHLNLNVKGPSAPLVCLHGYGDVFESFSLNPSDGITFENSKITLTDIKVSIENHTEVDVVGTNGTDTEIFMILKRSTNDTVRNYLDLPAKPLVDNTLTIESKEYSGFDVNIKIKIGESFVGPGFDVNYYMPDGSLYKTYTTDDQGVIRFNPDKNHAVGYLYKYDDSINCCLFSEIFNYEASENTVTNEIIGKIDNTIEYETPNIEIFGSECHSHFIYQKDSSMYGALFNTYKFVINDLRADVIFTKLNGEDDVHGSVNADGLLYLENLHNDMFVQNYFTPVATSGFAFNHWDINGVTYGPNTTFSIEVDSELAAQVFYGVAPNPEPQASETAQTSDNTPVAVLAVLLLSSCAVLAFSQRKRKSYIISR